MDLDNDVVDLGVGFQGVDSHFPSIAALLVTAKRRGGVENIMAVDPNGPCLESSGDFVGFVDVLRPRVCHRSIIYAENLKMFECRWMVRLSWWLS